MAKRWPVSLSKLLRGHSTRAPTQLARDSPATFQYFHSIYRNPIVKEAPRTRSWSVRTRTLSTGSSSGELDVSKDVDSINRLFAEAREEIEMAMESKETVYFNEEAESARDAVKKVLGLYEELIGRLDEKEKGGVQRSMGLKIEQLKAELRQLDD